jgi:glycosyltransferase 2 family protein
MAVKREPTHLHSSAAITAVGQFFADYFWFILKNVIGWILILASWPVGIVFPGPGGIPLFLIGFALVTFPGKRKLTARVLRGRELQLPARLFTSITAAAALIVPALLMLYLWRTWGQIEPDWLRVLVLIGLCIVGVVTTWIMMGLALRLVNLLLKGMPLLRRRIRPWLRRKGLHLLPPRYKRRDRRLAGAMQQAAPEDEILEIHERHHRRLWAAWTLAKHWGRRMLAASIIILIFLAILNPIRDHWDQVRGAILATSPWRFLLASLMFAAFLVVFRVVSWRNILSGLGHHLPLGAAARIWSLSELARYLPGAIWQVVGRIYLVRPYGVGAMASSTSQVVELTIFTLANILVAVLGLVWIATQLPEDSRSWLYGVAALVPLLVVLLVPRVFYGLMDQVLRLMKKPPVAVRLTAALIFGLLGWAIVGLLWQSLAVWVLLSPAEALGLGIEQIWLVAGAYCLAWCAGFLAVWMPGGLGVRELVFIKTMQFALPDAGRFGDEAAFLAFLAFLSVLLRLWATTGELILCGGAVFADRSKPHMLGLPATDRVETMPSSESRPPLTSELG